MFSNDATEYVRYEGVNDNGFGVVAKRVMRDRSLSVEAKAIYAYFCSMAGGGKSAFPSKDVLIKDLNMGYKRYLKHRKMLENRYIHVETEYSYSNGAPIPHNIYVILSTIAVKEDDRSKSSLNDSYTTYEPTSISTLEQSAILNIEPKQELAEGAISTSTEIENSFPQFAGHSVGGQNDHLHEDKNGSFPQSPVQPVGGQNDHSPNAENLSFPQFAGQSVGGQIGNVPKSTTSNNINNNITYNSFPIESIHPYLEDNLSSDSSIPTAEQLDGEYERISATAINRNRISDGRIGYENLRAKFSQQVIFDAWVLEQEKCQGREERYYTALGKWLNDGRGLRACKRFVEETQSKTERTNKELRNKAFTQLMRNDADFRALVEQDRAVNADDKSLVLPQIVKRLSEEISKMEQNAS